MLPLLLLSLAPAFQRSVPAPVSVEEPGPFGVDLALSPGEVLLQYTWDGRAPVPWFAPGARVFVPWGERGAGANVRLYLPGNSTLEAGLSGAFLVQQDLVGTGEGRYGKSLEFGSSSRLHVYLPPQDPSAIGWTLSFWVRPAAAAFGRKIVQLPGAVEVVLQGDGRPVAHLLPSGDSLVHTRALIPGEWSHLVVAYDPSLTRQMRFTVEGEARNLSYGAPIATRIAAELVAGDVLQNGLGFVGGLDELTLEALPLSTDGARLAAHRERIPGTHALEVITNYGLRTYEPTVGTIPAAWLDTPQELALGQFDGVLLDNGVLRWVPGRWRRVSTRGVPPARTTHPTLSIGPGLVWIFDGETRDTELNPGLNTSDTWILDRSDETWRRVDSPNAPAPRCHIPAAYSPDHGLVLIHGGWRNDVSPTLSYGDTWVYLVAERRWELRAPSGTLPPSGSDFALTWVPPLQRFLLFSTVAGYLYDPVADHWDIQPAPTVVDENGQPSTYSVPGSAMCGFDPVSGEVVLFGGHTGSGSTVFHDTTVLYDPLLNRFTVLAPPVHPDARVRSGFAYDPMLRRFVLFGGVLDQFSQRFDDLWAFDPATRTWSELACSNRPSARGGYFGMAYDDATDEFVLFGGRSDGEHWLDETQVLELRPNGTGKAVFTFDRLQGWNRRTWFADAVTPGDSSVSYLFRWSIDARRWSSWRFSLNRLGTQRFVQVVALLASGSSGEVPEIHALGLR